MAATPNPRGQFLQTLIMAALFMLIFQLMCVNPQQKAQQGWNGFKLDNVASVESAIRKANEDMLDITAATTLKNALNARISEAIKAKSLTENEAAKIRVRNAVVIADTQFRAGVARADNGRLRNAYHTLQAEWKYHHTAPFWKDAVAVKADPRGSEAGSWTAESLYDKTSNILSERSKSELIWGFIPGGYWLIDVLVAATGRVPAFSYAFAAFLLALLVRAIVYKSAQKQIMYGRRLGLLTPQLKEIREEFKEDQVEMNRRTMELYQKYGLNPLAGCKPALLQAPLFLTVYQCMLLYQFEFQKGTFLWINPATSKATNGIVGPNLGQQDIPIILLYGISMVISTFLQPVTDPTQVRQQRLMGIAMGVLFTVFMFTGAVPVVSGFVLYWVFTNILATAQSLYAYRLPVEPLKEVNTAPGGVRPGGGIWATRMQEMMEKAQAERERIQEESQGRANGKADKTEFIPPSKSSNGKSDDAGAAKHKPKKRQ